LKRKSLLPIIIFAAIILGLNLLTNLLWKGDADSQVLIRKEQIEDAYLRPGRAETISATHTFQVAQVHSYATFNSQAYFTAVGLLTSTTSPLNGEILIGYTGSRPLLGNIIPGSSNVSVENGAGWVKIAVASGYTVSIQKFTSSGTWTKPADLVAIYVRVVGGGGGGGSADSDGVVDSGAAGGGGGGYSEKWIVATSLGATETVTVGAAGTAGAVEGGSGGAGGNSSFGSHAEGNGGAGGAGSGSAPTTGANLAGGAGGTASSGNIDISGQTGGDGYVEEIGTFNMVTSGKGGDSGGGLGLGGASVVTTGTTKAGRAGTGNGGGGSGAANNDTLAAAAGGAGTAGLVIVVEFR